VTGRNANTITNCYWLDTTASAAVGNNTGTVSGGASFAAGAMPSPSGLHAAWGIVSGIPGAVNQYWKNLTGPNAVGASLPALWYE
jgi:hypothetical protein